MGNLLSAVEHASGFLSGFELTRICFPVRVVLLERKATQGEVTMPGDNVLRFGSYSGRTQSPK